MAYASGNTILDDEYNNFAGSLNNVLGTGAGDSGYGQSTIATVAPGTVISATQWSTLLNKISTMANHQGTSITAISNPSAGNQIQALAALQSNVTAVTGANRHNAAASGSTYTTGGTITRTTGWKNNVYMTHTVNFGSDNALRYFFNAGGRIALTVSRTGGTASNKNTGWTNLCNAVGTLNVTGNAAAKTIAGVSYTGLKKIGGSGSPTVYLTNYGYYAMSGTNTIAYRQYDTTANYTSNNYILSLWKTSPGIVYLQSDFNDLADANTDETVDGTLTSSISIILPSSTYFTNTWGTPTLTGGTAGS